MKPIEEIKKTVITKPLEETIKLSLTSVLPLLAACFAMTYRWLASRLSSGLLLALLSIETLLLLTLLIYTFRLRKLIKQLTPVLVHKFGIQWDKELNPFCPKCDKRLGPYANYSPSPGFHCIHCRTVLRIRHEDGSGKLISFEQAIAALKAGQK